MPTNDLSPVSIRIRLRYPDVDTFVANYAANISKGGMFIQSRAPQPVDTELKFEVLLENDAHLMRGVGRVIWVREYDAAHPERVHGMGLKFLELDPSGRRVVELVLSRKGVATVSASAGSSATQEVKALVNAAVTDESANEVTADEDDAQLAVGASGDDSRRRAQQSLPQARGPLPERREPTRSPLSQELSLAGKCAVEIAVAAAEATLQELLEAASIAEETVEAVLSRVLATPLPEGLGTDLHAILSAPAVPDSDTPAAAAGQRRTAQAGSPVAEALASRNAAPTNSPGRERATSGPAESPPPAARALAKPLIASDEDLPPPGAPPYPPRSIGTTRLPPPTSPMAGLVRGVAEEAHAARGRPDSGPDQPLREAVDPAIDSQPWPDWKGDEALSPPTWTQSPPTPLSELEPHAARANWRSPQEPGFDPAILEAAANVSRRVNRAKNERSFDLSDRGSGPSEDAQSHFSEMAQPAGNSADSLDGAKVHRDSDGLLVEANDAPSGSTRLDDPFNSGATAGPTAGSPGRPRHDGGWKNLHTITELLDHGSQSVLQDMASLTRPTARQQGVPPIGGDAALDPLADRPAPEPAEPIATATDYDGDDDLLIDVELLESLNEDAPTVPLLRSTHLEESITLDALHDVVREATSEALASMAADQATQKRERDHLSGAAPQFQPSQRTLVDTVRPVGHAFDVESTDEDPLQVPDGYHASDLDDDDDQDDRTQVSQGPYFEHVRTEALAAPTALREVKYDPDLSSEIFDALAEIKEASGDHPGVAHVEDVPTLDALASTAKPPPLPEPMLPPGLTDDVIEIDPFALASTTPGEGEREGDADGSPRRKSNLFRRLFGKKPE